jgi:uncharacterized protein DUF6599
MSRRHFLAALLLVFSVAAPAAILPPRMGDFNQTGTQPFTPPDAGIFREYGFDVGERASYVAGDRKMELTAIRTNDATGAFGIYHWLRPADGKSVELGERGVEKDDTVLFQYGNYVLTIRGARPEPDHLDALLSILPRFEHTAAPPVSTQMPPEALVANSERLVLGPAVLAKLAPRLPPSVVAFHFGTEGFAAEYNATGGRLRMIVFSYPTPQLARAQVEEFQKVPKTMVKRSGPLIATVVDPFSPDEAEKLLARVRYRAAVTWSEKPGPRRSENIGEFLFGVVMLCVVLAGAMLVAGVGLGGIRVLLRRSFGGVNRNTEEAPFIRLNIND